MQALSIRKNMQTSDNFQQQVLDRLDKLDTDVNGLKTDINALKIAWLELTQK